MQFTRAIPLVAAGLFAGIALVLSCGDDSPHKADAAVCDCPTAEPPINAARIVQLEMPFTVPANDRGGAGAACPIDAVLLSGGCAAAVGQVPQIILEQSEPEGLGWHCDWRNPTNAPIEVRAIARCLKPAP